MNFAIALSILFIGGEKFMKKKTIALLLGLSVSCIGIMGGGADTNNSATDSTAATNVPGDGNTSNDQNGNGVDDAAGDIGTGVEDAVDDVGNGIEDAVDDIGNGVDDTNGTVDGVENGTNGTNNGTNDTNGTDDTVRNSEKATGSPTNNGNKNKNKTTNDGTNNNR